MTEWIDFLVYSTMLVLFGVCMPRQGRSFTLPMIAERNPGWAAANPYAVTAIERSQGFFHGAYAWTALGVTLLLLATLGVISPPGGDGPKWETLKDLHGTFMIAGTLGWAVAAFLWSRWLEKHVPLADVRRASLRPRSASDYLPRSWRVAVEALTVMHLGVWVAIPALGYAADAEYWQRFGFIVFVTAVMAAVAVLTPRRPPGYPDRLFGEGYRSVELKAAYLLRLTPLIAGAMAVGEKVYGLEVDRVGNLVLVASICAVLSIFLRLKPVAGSGGGFAADRRLAA